MSRSLCDYLPICVFVTRIVIEGIRTHMHTAFTKRADEDQGKQGEEIAGEEQQIWYKL